MSHSKHMPPTKRKTNNRPAEHRPPNGTEIRPGMRRFAPTDETATDGGTVYGMLVANRRARLNMSREELAAKIGVSPSAVMRIEQGHPPDAEVRGRLGVILDPEPPGPLRHRLGGAVRTAAGAAAGAVGAATAGAIPERRPELHLDRRWLWGALAGALIILATIIGGWFSSAGGWFSSADGSPSPQPAVAVSNVLGPPAVIDRARVLSQKEARAQARRAAERAAAAAAAAEAAARRAAAKPVQRKVAGRTQTPIQPASPSLPPSTGTGTGGGGGGGGSSAPAPELNHGIGSDGGAVPPTGTGSTGDGSSSPPSSSKCAGPGIVC